MLKRKTYENYRRKKIVKFFITKLRTLYLIKELFILHIIFYIR